MRIELNLANSLSRSQERLGGSGHLTELMKDIGRLVGILPMFILMLTEALLSMAAVLQRLVAFI